jgi:hypothetical protein
LRIVGFLPKICVACGTNQSIKTLSEVVRTWEDGVSEKQEY